MQIKMIDFLGKRMLKQLLAVGTLWSDYIKGQRDPGPTKSQFACSSLKVTIYLVRGHKKKDTPEKTHPSGVTVTFQLTQRQSETKTQARFNQVHT